MKPHGRRRREQARQETPSGFLIPDAEDMKGLLAEAPHEPSAAERLAQQRAHDEADALSGISGSARYRASDADRTGTADAETAARPSRAHSATFLPDGRVATTDLGYDLVRIWRVTPSGLVPDHEIVLPFGVGPRHMVMHPSGHLHVITEFSCEVWTLAEGPDARWRVVASVPTGAFDGDTGAELTPGHGKMFLYAGLRGSDTIQVLSASAARASGSNRSRWSTRHHGAASPRGRARHAAGRRPELRGDRVAVRFDERTGVPGRMRHRLEDSPPAAHRAGAIGPSGHARDRALLRHPHRALSIRLATRASARQLTSTDDPQCRKQGPRAEAGSGQSRTRFPTSIETATSRTLGFSLANERTFLAWLRTSLALFAAAVALEALQLPIRPAWRLAAAAVFLILGLVAAAQAWNSVAGLERALRHNSPLPGLSIGGIIVIGVIVGAALVFIGSLV